MKPTVSEISSMARIISADEGMPEMYETSSPDLHRYKILKNYTLKFKVIKNQSLQFTFFFFFFDKCFVLPFDGIVDETLKAFGGLQVVEPVEAGGGSG